MAQAGYAITTEAAVALAAATPKSVIGVRAPATISGIQLKGFTVGFDGVTATAVPVFVELCYSTFATNAPGTNSTSVTVRQTYGRVIAASSTGARNWTTEPTVLTTIRSALLTPNGGLLVFQYPLGMEPDSAIVQGFVIRCTAPAIVNVRATMDFERI